MEMGLSSELKQNMVKDNDVILLPQFIYQTFILHAGFTELSSRRVSTITDWAFKRECCHAIIFGMTASVQHAEANDRTIYPNGVVATMEECFT